MERKNEMLWEIVYFGNEEIIYDETILRHYRGRTKSSTNYIYLYLLILILSLSVPQELDDALKICNYIFTLIFVLESVFKLVAFGFRRFFKDRSEFKRHEQVIGHRSDEPFCDVSGPRAHGVPDDPRSGWPGGPAEGGVPGEERGWTDQLWMNTNQLVKLS